MNQDLVIAATLLPTAVVLLLAGMWILRRLSHRHGWGAEIQRKAVHVVTGLLAIALPWLLPQPILVYGMLALTALVMVALRLPSVATTGIGAAVHGVERSSWGDFMLVAAVATLYFFSDQAGNVVLYVLPLAVLTLADAAAALAGSHYGRMRFAVEDGEKSIEGSAIFFLITCILAMVALLLLSDVSRANVVLLSLLIAAFATVVEADSWRGFDNYFVPVGILFLLVVHMDSPPWMLALLAIGFLAVLNLLRVYGGALLDLSDHTARAYTAGLFLIGAVTTLPNMILPASTLAAQAFARRHNPSTSRHPDLDMLALLAVVSFGILIGGTAMGRSAITFYGMVCAGLLIQLVMLALVRMPLWIRLAVAMAATIGLTALTMAIIGFNPEHTRWHGPIAPLMALGLAFAAAISTFSPNFYRAQRHAKVGLIGALGPVLVYLFLYAGEEGLWS